MDSAEYAAALGAITVKDSDEAALAGVTGSNYPFSMLDQAAPTVSTCSPSRETKFVTTSRNLLFSFAKTVQLDGAVGI